MRERERERERKRNYERVTVHATVYHLNTSYNNSYAERTCTPKLAISYYGVKADRLYHVIIGYDLVNRYFYPYFEIYEYEFTFLSKPNL